MQTIRHQLELLSPARDLQCGLAAISHGADAVYIGAPQFGARHAAGNNIADIERLASFAHIYGAKVFVTLNTLLFDSELQPAVDMAWQLHRAGVDAFIVQDVGLLECDLPPVPLHASTQTDNRTAAKVRFWQDAGFEQVVLARELSEQQIRQIADATTVRLEFFVHGALCVSYSGQCFMSQCINGRSANRGECGQPCRLAYDLIDRSGNVIERNRHLLSLKDMNQSANIERLIDAGVSSFKIEGRLKEADYVSNVTLHYRRIIDGILQRRPELCHSSSGSVEAGFEPDPRKSFNRDFTTYFFSGRRDDIWRPQTPKMMGERVGRVVRCDRTSFEVDTRLQLANGDGICFVDRQGALCGTQVNTAEGRRLTPQKMAGIVPGTVIFRNFDIRFDAMLKRDATRRTVALDMTLSLGPDGRFALTLADDDGVRTQTVAALAVQPANNAAAARANMERQFQKLGGTPYAMRPFATVPADASWFVAAAELNSLRRDAVAAHTAARQARFAPRPVATPPTSHPYVSARLGRADNVINGKAAAFYARHGAVVDEAGYECRTDYQGSTVMTTKHCLMDARGCCLRLHPEARKMLPLTLQNDKDRYRLEFDCAACVMKVIRL